MEQKPFELENNIIVKPIEIDKSINVNDKEQIDKLKFSIKNLISVVNNAYHKISPMLDQLK